MKTVDISGMDKSRARFGYEWGCQVIAARALYWLKSQPPGSERPKILQFSNFLGVTLPENAAAKELERFATDNEKLREYGATGAMVQYAINHALKRHAIGDEAYFKAFEDEPERIFEFDEADAFPEGK